MLQGKIMVCYAAFVLLHIDLFSSILKCVICYFEITKMNRLTQIFLYRFYKVHIPELRLWFGSGVDCVETNPAPIVTDFNVS